MLLGQEAQSGLAGGLCFKVPREVVVILLAEATAISEVSPIWGIWF